MRPSSHPETLWLYPNIDPAWVDSIVHEFKIHPVTAQVLAARGFSSFDAINHYLYAKLPDLYDPSLFPQMDLAVERVHQALVNKESILIYGDNDVDGITGTTLLTEFFRKLGCKVFFFIHSPHLLNRSLMMDAIEYAVTNSCRLLITVDCGITASKEIAEAAKRNVDVIVTDHHEPMEKLPHCCATLNPKLLNSSYPNRELTGVGVAFKLAHAVINHLSSLGEIAATKIDLKSHLDLVAMGIVADMGPLLDENRILVRYGLRQMKKKERVGLDKLLQICEITSSDITPMDIASKIAPRLNSLGRIADPNKGVELLLAHDSSTAEKLAQELEFHNAERQKIERKDTEDVDLFLKEHPAILQDRALVLSSSKWHPGIIPIITTRISKQFNRPTAVIAVEQGIGKGSLRTIPEFPLLPILKDNADLLLNYGGHDCAAGLSIKEENIAAFAKNFTQAANKCLSTQDIATKLQLDAEISFKDLTFEFLESLNLLEPFGTGNPVPIFYCNAKQSWAPKVVGKMHLKLYLEQGDRILEGIGFGLADRRSSLCKKGALLHIAFTPHLNTFLNKSSIQLLIKDFKVLSA